MITARLDAGDDLSIQSIESLEQEWGETFQHADSVELDLSSVQEFDTAGVQLLLRLQRQAQKQGKVMTIKSMSEVVYNTLELCRLDSLLPKTIEDEGAARIPHG